MWSFLGEIHGVKVEGEVVFGYVFCREYSEYCSCLNLLKYNRKMKSEFKKEPYEPVWMNV